jgi:hypothetical protein
MAISSVSGNPVSQIAGAIKDAAQTIGISFEYLLATAKIESNLNPAAQAPTSSAKGLYQFIDQTWLGTMKQAGSTLGLSRYADAISQTSDGRYEVADPAMRAAIMRLRGDPSTSAMLAGALTRSNAAQVSAVIGRPPTEGELYIAHFLGPDGASRLIGAASSRPRASAATMFPQAAAANPSIFYDRAGHARSVSAVYATLTGRFAAARAAAVTPDLRGTIAPVVTSAPAEPRAPDTAGITQALAQANQPSWPPSASAPLFQSMFSDRERTALAPTVNSLWATPKGEGGASAQALDLFTDGRADIRRLFGNG